MLRDKLHIWPLVAIFMMVLGLPDAANAQTFETHADSTEVQYIHFRVGQALVEPRFKDNARVLDDIVNTLLRLQDNQEIDSIKVNVEGLTSIEGTSALNEKLALSRAVSLRDYIAAKTGLGIQHISAGVDRSSWAQFRRLVADDSFEYRDEVLRIIDSPESEDARERQIVGLHGGRVLQYLQKDILPKLRGASVVTIYIYKVLAQPQQPVAEVQEPQVEEPTPQTPPQEPVMQLVEEPEPAPAPAKPARVYDEIHPWIAVKTNLLLDAALTPNIEIERWFGKHNHWSAMAEVWFPWYTVRQNSRAYQVLTIGAELRYWFFPHNGNLRPLHGQFIGVYGAGGKYDLEWSSKGNQGEFTSMGLTYGYAFRLAKHFNMELSLSGGYIGGPYRYYKGMFSDTHLIWQRSEKFRYWGITKAKVSLVWLIGDKK